MEYISSKEAAERWHISIRAVQNYCKSGRLNGSKKFGTSWFIPANSVMPSDGRKAENEATAETHYLPYVFVGTAVFMPVSNPYEALNAIQDEKMRNQFTAEIAYLKGDYEYIKKYCDTVSKNDTTYICACAVCLLSAVSSGDYPLYEKIKEKLVKIVSQSKNRTNILAAETALATFYVSIYTPDSVPEWLKQCDFSEFPEECRPWLLYLYAKYLQCFNRPEAILSLVQATLALSGGECMFSSTDIYLKLLGASSLCALSRYDEANRWLEQILKITLPYGFITPYSETVTAYGGILEKNLKEHWQSYHTVILKQWTDIWKNWIVFHNQYAKANITLVLTLREYQLAGHLARGMTYSQAAQCMGVSLSRIKNMVSVIYQKLYITKKKELKQFIL